MRKSFNFRSTHLFPNSVDRNVVSVLLINLIWTIPWGLVNPFISPYFFELSNGDYFLTGLLNGLPFISMIASVFIFGRIVDKIGSKKVMITAFSIFFILFLTLIMITDPFLFFIDYVILNSLLACFGPAVWKYASLTGRNDIFGSLSASTSLGFFFGTVMSGFLYEQLGMNTLFFLSLGACVLGFIIACISHDLQESEETKPEEKYSNLDNNQSSNIFSVLNDSKILIPIFVIAAIHYFLSTFGGVFVSVYFLDELNAPALLIGIVFGIATLSGTVVSHFAGKIGERRGYKEILTICYCGHFLVWITFFFSTSDYLLPALVYMLPIYIGIMITGPALVSEHIPESKRGTVMGILGASQNLGIATGSILGGLFAGIQGTFRFNFGVSAIFSILLIVIAFIFIKNGKKDTVTFQD